MAVDRRTFLRHAALASGVTLGTPFESFFARLAAAGRHELVADGFGPLSPVRDESTGLPLLHLPRGFKYLSYGWYGDRMDGGLRVPGAHDGMAAFPGTGSRVLLVRNHEVKPAGKAFDPKKNYDPVAGGGTTTLEFDTEKGKWMSARASLAGTSTNCAGGPTPWGTWLTCEEVLWEPGPGLPWKEKHGYTFEVPLHDEATCEPLVAMGRFVHEAAAVDPATGCVYETQDALTAGLYRFTPKVPGRLAEGGRLEMLAVAGRPQFDLRSGLQPGVQFPVTWVPIDDPDRPHDRGLDGRGVFAQGFGGGGAVFARLEGCTYGGGKIFVTSTTGGNAKMGQIWELDPARDSLRLVFESPGPEVLNMPDNACPSPRGGIVICEDGTMNPCVQGLTLDGRIFRFARNNIILSGERNGIRGDYTRAETAGATFSPDGQWLFFNIQGPGITFAVTGPWENGLL